LDGFFSVKHVHWSFDEAVLQDVSALLRELYLDIRSHVWGLRGIS